MAALSSAVVGQVRPESPATAPVRGAEQARKTLDTYCVGCHNTRAKAGGLALDATPVDAVSEHPDVWEAAVRKLRGRLMPPPGSPQPDQQDIDAFVSWMEHELDRNPGAPKAGYVGIQRLSRTEYVAAVKALVGVEIVGKDILPQDAAVDGFDNIASALSVSPTFVEQYVEAARVIAKKAIGDRSLEIVAEAPPGRWSNPRLSLMTAPRRPAGGWVAAAARPRLP